MSDQPGTASPLVQRPGPRAPASRGRKISTRAQRWMRWLHVYASMIAFVVILFFGATGILLNHPTWLMGNEVTVTTFEGSLPEAVAEGDRIEFLAVSEFVRSEHGVGGEVTNFDQVGNEGSINYTGPAYGATVRFDTETLRYDVTLREEGFVNAMRDLHSGSDTGSVWGLVIDVSSAFLVFVALTGLGIQLMMRKRRKSALLWLSGAALLTAALMWFTLV